MRGANDEMCPVKAEGKRQPSMHLARRGFNDKTISTTPMAFILTHSFNEVVSNCKVGVYTAASRQILRSPELCGEGVLFAGLE